MRRTNLFRMVAATAAATLIATAGATAVANPAGAARPAAPAAAPSTGFAPAATNLAQGRPTQESGHADVYDSSRVVDGNAGSYWESLNNSFPQWVQVDLGSAQSVNQVVLKLPTNGWATRTQTLSVRGSANGSSFTDMVGSQTYTFNPASGSTVTINFSQTSTRYVRITVTANSGWPAGQLSELEVYGSGGTTPDTTAPSVPGNLSYTQSGTTISLNWVASTDNAGGSGIAGYDVYRNGAFLQSIGNVTTFNDTQPATATVSYHVRARDAAGNLSGNSNTVTRTGSGGDTTAPSVPGTLSQSTSGSTITLTWGASTDSGGSGLAGYNVYRGGNLIATLGTVLSYQDTQPATATVSYHVRARDAPATSPATATPSPGPAATRPPAPTWRRARA
ncbi:discoidin domain-containing protein [Micromonospora tarensis]|uniref:discoidin domain-containing protein n=1 Tax=Micromonospora tarensis TaxID=2806100 RepID=UPI001EE4AE9E|nr:discoidin domain-containing protein [Micromonospora tarensis]